MLASTTKLQQSSCEKCAYRSERLFCNLGTEALAAFDAIGMQIQLPAGAILFEESERADGVFVICSGQVKLSCSSREGRTLILRIARPGDVLGLGAVVSGTSLEVTAETLEHTMVKKIRAAEFISFLERFGEASMHAAKTLSEDYKTAFFDARRLALSGSAAARLASVLLEWGKSTSCSTSEMYFKMGLTHEELASIAGTSRETVTRILGKFQKEKLIQVRGATFHILAPLRLAELCV